MPKPAEIAPLRHWGYDYFLQDYEHGRDKSLEDIMKKSILPDRPYYPETPPDKQCGYDYCSEVRDPYKSVEEILTQPVLQSSVDTALILVRAAEALQDNPLEEKSAFSGNEVPVPGGILPVDEGTDDATTIHTLTINKDGVGVLRSPKGTERPLTTTDMQLFKQYFLNLGKILKTMQPVSGT